MPGPNNRRYGTRKIRSRDRTKMLKIYDSFSRQKKPFKSSNGIVKMFVCGPTVYDYVHLGHARTYVAFDIITRYLTFIGFSLQYIMNITDVADKITDRAKEVGKDPIEFAREYERAFIEDMLALGITNVQGYIRASEHIPQMISQVSGLIERGVAYETNTGVYFEVNKFPAFGTLSGLNREELSLRRLELCSSKKNPEDFSVWRKNESLPGWNSPWGFGRPGWHVEDTAISMSILGDTYDIHGGASELIFPHHEAEIAQAEALTGKTPFVRFWLHTGLLNLKGRKMSKSLGNVIRIRDALKHYSPEDLRYYFASYHYRTPIVMSELQLKRSIAKRKSMIKKFVAFSNMRTDEESDDDTLIRIVMRAEHTFRKHMDNDFDTFSALTVIVKLSEDLSQFAKNEKINSKSKRKAENIFRMMANVFGIMT